MTMHKTELLARLPRHDRAREPIVGGGAGTGISAKSEEAAAST